jgi:hypothetical protein
MQLECEDAECRKNNEINTEFSGYVGRLSSSGIRSGTDLSQIINPLQIIIMIIAMSRSNASFSPWILGPSVLGTFVLLVIIHYVWKWFRVFRTSERRRIKAASPQGPDVDSSALLLEQAEAEARGFSNHGIQFPNFANFPSIRQRKQSVNALPV